MTKPQKRCLRRNLPAGLALAGLITCIVAAERFDVARTTIASVRDAGGTLEAGALPWLWLVTMVVGAGLAVLVAAGVATEAGGQGEQVRVFRMLAFVATGVWGAWQLYGILAVLGADGPGTVRTALHAGAIVLAIAALAGAGSVVAGDPVQAWRHGSVVRVELVVLSLFFAVAFLVPITSGQVTEVLRAWGDSPSHAAVGLAAAVLLGAVCRATAMRALLPANDASWPLGRAATGMTVGAFVLLAALLAYTLAWLGLIVMGLIAAIVLIAEPASPIVAPETDDATRARRARRLAGTLGVVPVAIVLAGLASATVDSFLLPSRGSTQHIVLLAITIGAIVLFGALAGGAQCPPSASHEAPAWLVCLTGLCLPLVTVVLTRVLDGIVANLLWATPLLAGAIALAARPFGDDGTVEPWAGFGVGIGTVVAIYLDPIGSSRAVGAVGVALVGVMTILVGLFAATSVGNRLELTLEWLPRRVPVITLVAVWIGAAAALPVKTFHQARTTSSHLAATTLDKAVLAWLRGDASTYRTMVLVGASGGGSKAGYWTDLVVDCVMGEEAPAKRSDWECPAARPPAHRMRQLFLTSSVSGGSVGVYHYAMNRSEVARGDAWVDAAAGPEVLSPITAWGLFHDLPALLTHMSTDPRHCDGVLSCRRNADRALVQEAAVADFKDDIKPPAHGRLLKSDDGGPVMVFNGALDGGKGRVLLSRLQLAPARPSDPGCNTPQSTTEPAAGSVDADDVLDRKKGRVTQDVPLVTAALLSARFPVVAPAARLGDTTGSERRCATALPLAPLTVRDGGYMENTGLLTITELLPTIRAAINGWRATGHGGVHVQLIVISIDDDPALLDANQKLTKPGRNFAGITQRSGPEYLSRLARDRLTSCQYPDVTYVRISPPPHVGAHAATGWEVSETARRHDLADALAANRTAGRKVDLVRKAMDGDIKPIGCNTLEGAAVARVLQK